MQIYNSLRRSKENFEPAVPGNVRIYACGITAYDFCHIGHARSAIVFDTLVRHLRLKGYNTLFIRNFTDIDDKIINRANQEKRNWREVGETYISAFHEDMDRLGVNRPNMEPRATEFIPQIIDICQKLIAAGLAYPTQSGDVYFRARSYKPYGKLSGRNVDELRSGARIAPGEEKEDPLDFALWKAAKPDEPFWESPWGKGRPGWHIECTAMTAPHLPLDIHGGGLDLIFPHHENEMAQTEAAFHVPLANYWVHNGFVRIDSEKMSKSLGNFKTIRQILETWLPETLRFFLLTKHYRSPIDFNLTNMLEAEKAQQRVYTTLAETADALKRTSWKNTPLPQNLLEEWRQLDLEFSEALDDDLNTAQAIGAIFSQTRFVNRILEDRILRKSKSGGVLLDEYLARSRKWSAELGLFSQEPGEFLENLRKVRIRRLDIDLPAAQLLLTEREKARQDRDFARSDVLRSELARLGIDVRDTPAGQKWDVLLNETRI